MTVKPLQSIRSHLQRFYLASIIVIAGVSLCVVVVLSTSVLRRNEATYYTGLSQVLSDLVKHSLELSDYSDTQRMLSLISRERGVVPAILTDDGDLLLGDYGRAALFEPLGLTKLSHPTCADVTAQTLTGGRKLFCSEIEGVKSGLSGGKDRIGLSLVLLDGGSGAFSIKQFAWILSALLLGLLALAWSARSYFTSLFVVPLEDLRAWVLDRKAKPLAPLTVSGNRGRLREIDDLKSAFEELFEAVQLEAARRQESERQLALQDLARQVAHDIRSPLAALDSVMRDLSDLSEDRRSIIRSAVSRIRDIANDLIEKNRDAAAQGLSISDIIRAATEEASVQLVSSHVDALISEKRLQFRSRMGIDIDSRLEPSSYGLFAKIQPVAFKRALSNLVNNAVEASGEKGKVVVELGREGESVVLRVRDDGKGIAPDILPRLGHRGMTHGKSEGTGLGLFYARTSVESWGGTLSIESKVDHGTIVTLRVPQSPAPAWFVSELGVQKGDVIVVVDDDNSIHQVWQGRFDSQRVKDNGVETVHFSTPKEFRAWVMDEPEAAAKALYLVDYELLGYSETGLSLIAELGLSERAILVTSRFEEKNILDDCVRLGIRMIPKGMAGFVPIRVALRAKRREFDAVLIDDDALVHAVWKAASKASGKKIKAFSSPAEFERGAKELDKDTTIYIDSNLADGIKGEEYAKTLSERGYTNIILCTGHPAESFSGMPWLSAVVGKDAPWPSA